MLSILLFVVCLHLFAMYLTSFSYPQNMYAILFLEILKLLGFSWHFTLFVCERCQIPLMGLLMENVQRCLKVGFGFLMLYIWVTCICMYREKCIEIVVVLRCSEIILYINTESFKILILKFKFSLFFGSHYLWLLSSLV